MQYKWCVIEVRESRYVLMYSYVSLELSLSHARCPVSDHVVGFYVRDCASSAHRNMVGLDRKYSSWK